MGMVSTAFRVALDYSCKRMRRDQGARMSPKFGQGIGSAATIVHLLLLLFKMTR